MGVFSDFFCDVICTIFFLYNLSRIKLKIYIDFEFHVQGFLNKPVHGLPRMKFFHYGFSRVKQIIRFLNPCASASRVLKISTYFGSPVLGNAAPTTLCPRAIHQALSARIATESTPPTMEIHKKLLAA
jgi:hypothetical protein